MFAGSLYHHFHPKYLPFEITIDEVSTLTLLSQLISSCTNALQKNLLPFPSGKAKVSSVAPR